MTNAHEQLLTHAREAIRLIEDIEAKAVEAHKRQLAVIAAMIVTIDGLCKPKGELK